MCNVSGIVFGATRLTPQAVKGADILEVGACNVNGSLRQILEAWQPQSYWGVDVVSGPGVDELCPCEDLLSRYGAECFDLVISTELLEHVRDWRQAIHQLKGVCKPGGEILLTTRSIGFAYHGYPYDFWRFQPDDMQQIFADCELLALESDAQDPGVFVHVRKPLDFQEAELSELCLYSIVTGERQLDYHEQDLRSAFFRRQRGKQLLKAGVFKLGKRIWSWL